MYYTFFIVLKCFDYAKLKYYNKHIVQNVNYVEIFLT